MSYNHSKPKYTHNILLNGIIDMNAKSALHSYI